MADPVRGLDGTSTLEGRVAVVTGANSGIGRAVAAALAGRGATVVMACRNLERARRAREAILEDDPDGSLDIRRCDLADLDGIATFAEGFLGSYDRLDLLCNNAGVMAIPRRSTADGFERQFGVNHLGHFALTGRLLGRILATDGGPRVVTQASNMHRVARGIDFDDLDRRRRYRRWLVYAESKLANVLFARELDRRLAAAGRDALSPACEPGFVATNLHYVGPRMEGSRLKHAFWRVAYALFGRQPRAGAEPMLAAALADDVERGDYLTPGGPLHLRGRPVRSTPARRARDRDLAVRLWTVSESMTGVTYDLPEGTP